MNEALELRLQGLILREIAKQMRISVSTAHSYVEDALAEIPRVNAEAVLTQQLASRQDGRCGMLVLSAAWLGFESHSGYNRFPP